MTGESHLEIAMAASAASVAFIPSVTPATIVAAIAVGGIMGLVPDVDAPHHKLRGTVKRGLKKLFLFDTTRTTKKWLTISNRRKKARKDDWLRYSLYPFVWLFVLLWSLPGRLLSTVAEAIFDIIPSFLTHRRETHSLMAILFVSAVFGGIALAFPIVFPVSVGAVAGYTSHILADCMTVSGVQFWWPFSLSNFHIIPKRWRIHTGQGLRRMKLGTDWICFPTERQIALVFMALGCVPLFIRLYLVLQV